MKSAPTEMPARFLGLVFALATAALIVASAPASLVPAIARRSDPSVVVGKAGGTLWRGELAGVTARGALLGDIAYNTDPFSLFFGRLSMDVSFSNGAIEGGGKMIVAPAGLLVVEDAKLLFSLSAANRYAMLGTPLSGTVRAEIEHLSLSRRGCLDGAARLSTDVLIAPAKRFGSEAFDLSGEGVCRNGDLVVTLAGSGGEGTVSLAMSISPSLTYVLSAEAQPARREVADALQVLGFERTGGVLTIGASGAIGSVGS